MRRWFWNIDRRNEKGYDKKTLRLCFIPLSRWKFNLIAGRRIFLLLFMYLCIHIYIKIIKYSFNNNSKVKQKFLSNRTNPIHWRAAVHETTFIPQFQQFPFNEIRSSNTLLPRLVSLTRSIIANIVKFDVSVGGGREK